MHTNQVCAIKSFLIAACHPTPDPLVDQRHTKILSNDWPTDDSLAVLLTSSSLVANFMLTLSKEETSFKKQRGGIDDPSC